MTHLTDDFYVNDNYPLSVDVFATDGLTPVLPLSATIDIINENSGDTYISGDTCQVASGLATYFVLSNSNVSQTAGNYVGYMRVMIDSSVTQTQAIHFNVLSKGSYLAVDRWRRKVEDSAPSEEHTSDEHGRDWIDQAVGLLNNQYDTGFSSTLGVLSGTSTSADIEFVAQVASIMARTAWWAGKGTWRDEEMSFDGTPFATEWKRIETYIASQQSDGWFDDDAGGTSYNRDRVYYRGIKYDSPTYWERDSTDPVPDTEIPI